MGDVANERKQTEANSDKCKRMPTNWLQYDALERTFSSQTVETYLQDLVFTRIVTSLDMRRMEVRQTHTSARLVGGSIVSTASELQSNEV